MDFDYKNKCVLITGGSRGIGRACAQLFASAGAKVAITYLSNKYAAEEVLAGLNGSGHIALQLEMKDPTSVAECFYGFIQQYGRIDVLVNNAGVYLEHKILETDYETWQKSWSETLAINLTGPANLCHQAAGKMVELGGGSIVNISSRGAFRGEPDHPAYGASKAGLNAMSQSLAVALAPYGISIHVIAPGFVETDMAADILNGPMGESIKQQSPFGRVARPEEVARLVAMCASKEMIFSSGSIIDINGASYLRS